MQHDHHLSHSATATRQIQDEKTKDQEKIIEIDTEAGKSWSDFRKNRSPCRIMGFSVASAISLPLLFTVLSESWPWLSGDFLQGADTGYPTGFNEGRNSVNASDYHLMLLPTTSEYYNPKKYEIQAWQNHLIISMLTSFISSILLSLGPLGLVSHKPGAKITKYMIYGAAIGIIPLIQYSLFGGFNYVHGKSNALLQEGITIGNHIYGFYDGHNSLCPTLLNTTHCPGSIYGQAINTSLGNLADENLLTATSDATRFFSMFAFVLMPAAASGLLSLGEWLFKKCKFFKSTLTYQPLEEQESTDDQSCEHLCWRW